jgi:hypothetical protein
MTETSTTTWQLDELTRLGGADKIDISTRRIDAAYCAKYARYGESYLTTMLGEQAVASTLKLNPRR